MTTQDYKKTVLKLIPLIRDHGLTNGMGAPSPGEMCVETAVCYAMGKPHGDDPGCVGESVRAYKIRLNNSRWSSDKARGRGMLGLAIAQLGSDSLDQVEFASRLVIKTVNILLPSLFKDLGIDYCMKECIEAKTVNQAYSAAYAADYAAADYAAADYAAARAVARAAAAAAAAAAAYAADYAAADYAAAAAAGAAADGFLKLSANLALETLKEMKSPGCEYLHLIQS